MGRLDGKRAIVTGAASGIGRAAAIRMAEEGASVLVVDVAEAGLAETEAAIEAAGGRAIAQAVDASEEAAVAAVVDRCVREWGGLEAMFANAGVTGPFEAFFDLTADDWRRVVEVNLIGPFLAIKHAARVMRPAGHGSIVCTASVAGIRSGAGPTPYSATKAGVINMVRTTANQLAGTGVRVNAVCPGLIETGMTQPIFELARAAGKEHKIGQLNPLKRAGLPVEVATVVAFLASDDASYLNGQAIAVDGGLSSSHPVVPGRLA
jgi:NAD(P)-dependent dehydrogenase (short-subunit alcohol dehydrogenase family)